jgi:dTDP-glucose pyrophosphorylase
MIEYEKYIVNENKDIVQALIILNELTHKVLIVTDDKGKLRGTITDGDFRRWIINKDKQGICKSLMNRDCLYANKENLDKVASKAKKKGVSLLPLVNNENIVIGAYEIDFILTEKKKNTVVIMAGGKGTRLLPLTQDIPKPMIKVGGKPIITRIIEKLILEGFENIIISVGHLSEVIEEHIKNSNFDASIILSKEEMPLGTAGSLSQICKNEINYPILVTNGDILSECNYYKIVEKAKVNNFDAIMLGKEEIYKIPYGVIKHTNQIWEGIIEKPTYSFIINAGVYVLSKSMIELIEDNKYLDMPTLFKKASEKNLKLAVDHTSQYWIDIGRHETLESANNYFKN